MLNQNSLLRLVLFARPITSLAYKLKPACLSRFHHILNTPSRNHSSYADANIYSYNKTINDLIKSGSLDSAFQLFDGMPVRDVVSWNIMISGQYRHGFVRESLYLYNQMVCQGFVENSSTFSSVLSMCSNSGFYRVGVIAHSRAIILGFTMNIYIGTAIVDLYMQMDLFDVALRFLRTLPERNVATWNVVLRRACESGRSKMIFSIYDDLKLDKVEPNGLSLCYLIQGCGHERYIDEGMQLHCCVIKKGIVDSNLFVTNALVDFYSACGNLLEAKRLFEIIYPENVISWNSMVSVSSANGDICHALGIYNEMHLWCKKPSVSSFLGFLKFSSGKKNILLGKQVHCCILKLGFDTVLVHSALIDIYGKCGDIESAVRIFDGISGRSIESCNSFMTSLLRFGLKEDVIELFGLMIDDQIGYDEVSLSSTLKAVSMSSFACSSSCNILHCCAVKSGFECDNAVASSLIDAYSRLGEVKIPTEIFDQVSHPNVTCVTSMITAFARNGLGRKCLEVFDMMIRNGLKPDKITFLSVLMGCNHSGLVQDGRLVFHSMQTEHGAYPSREHYSCFVDLLCRAGFLEEAERVLRGTPWEGDTAMWSSVLRSCGAYQNELIGKKASRLLIDLDPENPAGFLQASNFYSDIGEFESSEQFREDSAASKMSREVGRSLIEVCEFSQ